MRRMVQAAVPRVSSTRTPLDGADDHDADGRSGYGVGEPGAMADNRARSDSSRGRDRRMRQQRWIEFRPVLVGSGCGRPNFGTLHGFAAQDRHRAQDQMIPPDYVCANGSKWICSSGMHIGRLGEHGIYSLDA
jgi:hypothetical protein